MTIVFEGDWGGQIYATYKGVIKPSRETLRKTLRAVDSLEWPCNEGDGVFVYEQDDTKAYVLGGMGGAPVVDGLWVHEDLCDKSIDILTNVFGPPDMIGDLWTRDSGSALGS